MRWTASRKRSPPTSRDSWWSSSGDRSEASAARISGARIGGSSTRTMVQFEQEGFCVLAPQSQGANEISQKLQFAPDSLSVGNRQRDYLIIQKAPHEVVGLGREILHLHAAIQIAASPFPCSHVGKRGRKVQLGPDEIQPHLNCSIQEFVEAFSGSHASSLAACVKHW